MGAGPGLPGLVRGLAASLQLLCVSVSLSPALAASIVRGAGIFIRKQEHQESVKSKGLKVLVCVCLLLCCRLISPQMFDIGVVPSPRHIHTNNKMQMPCRKVITRSVVRVSFVFLVSFFFPAGCYHFLFFSVALPFPPSFLPSSSFSWPAGLPILRAADPLFCVS